MSEQSSMHAYVNWTKQRLDEMDATLASLESKAGQLQADSKTKANQLIAEMKKRRDEFRAKAKAQAQSAGAALEASKTQLESQWRDFEGQVKTYFDTVGKQVEQQQATFRDAAAAQMRAWHDAAGKIQDEAKKFASDRRAAIDAAVKKMEADASAADARLQKLKQAGNESWTALSAALADSRKAFDHASQTAWDAVNRAAAPSA